MDAPQPDPFTARFLARVPRAVADSFTAPQLAAIRFAFGLRYAPRHRIDFRRRMGRLYFVLLAGRDGR